MLWICLYVHLHVRVVHKVNTGNVYAGLRLGVSLGHAPPQGWPDEPRVKKRTSVASKLTLRIPVSIFRELEWEIGAVVVLYPPSFYVKVENLNSSSCLYSKHFIHFICFPSPINDVSVDAHRNYISYIG